MLETLLKPDDTVERCGLILDDDTVVEITNIAEEPENGYDMDPTEVLGYMTRIKGTWHTHPHSDPTLSGDDQKGFLSWPNWFHAIIGRRDGNVHVLRYKVEDGLVISCD